MGIWVARVLVVAAIAAAVSTYLAIERRLAAQGHRPRAPVPPTPSPVPELAATATRFRGGARIGRLSASLLLGRLALDGEHARVWAAPPAVLDASAGAWIARSGVDEVRPVRVPMGNGVRFASAAGTYDAVIFWTGFTADSMDPVLAALRDHGWPVTTD